VIAEAKVKTDKVDAEILARLLAADFLPPVWVPDRATDHLRHLVFHRLGLVGQRTQAKNRMHAILGRNLLVSEHTDLFGKADAGSSRPPRCRPRNAVCWRPTCGSSTSSSWRSPRRTGCSP
jgi:transposase